MFSKLVCRVKKVSKLILGEETTPRYEDPIQLKIESFENYMRVEVM